MGAAVLAVLVAAGVTVIAWAQPMSRLDQAQARAFTEEAFGAAGFDDVDVRSRVRSGIYPGDNGRASGFDVWITYAQLDGAPVKLWVDRDGVQAVQIDDNTRATDRCSRPASSAPSMPTGSIRGPTTGSGAIS